MNDKTLNIEPEGLKHVAVGLSGLSQQLLNVEPLNSPENYPPTVSSWLDVLPRIAEEIEQVADFLRTVAQGITAADDDFSARFAQHCEER
ncbi:hypothetical protein [Micromonospora sp. NPDC005313]|uniref:hypothetical protein n=1 Tax=Micromonospora sp. NPDC005313 TaxID=3154296 RepID=UPI0033B4F3A7